jgi:predicted dehydrogenase
MSLGIPVLCEAPPAINPDETQRILSSETSHRVPLQIATKFRHLPEVRKAQYLVQNGILGTPLTFRVEFASQMSMEGRWEGDGRAAGGGAWLHLGFHAVDLVRFLLSGITKIHGTQPRPRQNVATDDAAILVAHTECGATGTILTSWNMSRQDDTPYLLLQGTEGRIEIGWKASFLYLNGEAPVEIGAGFSERAAHKRMMRMFRDICAGAEDPWITPEEVMSASLTVEAGYRSMQSGRTIRVPAAASGLRARLASSL